MKESKFRRLTLEELLPLKPQFVKFLSVHGIDAGSWEKMKTADPERAEGFILQFSQTIFAGVIDKVEYLLHVRPQDLRTYKTGPDKIEMRGVFLPEETSFDFTQEDLPAKELFARLRSAGVRPKLYAAERAYLPIGRDQDLFLLMEEGALITDGGWFGVLEALAG
ncbi:DUF6495 family protein [Neolewinella lacunae]|uniref:Uncharacterized protein n=1 Tax=Neolewinella lacunae TaxID=1517758 RepID=A0A923PLD9_9BACT|nr:DUF6495 family protein [Neolewinella lacunae]MBC6996195.1 hypothetical protein [Neolewinella lacunae]MDN3637152.1 DUF6495 family protein [Neolewinella lacunae]